MEIQTKLCQCGCGLPTTLAASTRSSRGDIKGQPLRFRRGHGGSVRRIHGMKNSPEFRAYHDAKQRCTNRKCERWFSYGGRGVRFLFTSFEQFYNELGPRTSPKHSLDRINTDGNYEPGNVRWATSHEQMVSRRLSGAALTSHLKRTTSRLAA